MADPTSDQAGLFTPTDAPGVIYEFSNSHKSTRASIRLLPIEILVMIFGYCQLEPRRSVGLGSVQLVCRAWKGLVDGNAILWKSIKIELVDNEQLRHIEPSLHDRLKHQHPNTTLDVEVYMAGQENHPDDCECEETGECDFQTELSNNLRRLLRVLIGPQGRYMARWTSFMIDIMEWAHRLEAPNIDFRGLFSYPAPLLQQVELWALNTADNLFENAPMLQSIRLMDCMLDNPLSLSHVREIWVDHFGLGVAWNALGMVEELTIRIPREGLMGDVADGLVFPNIRKLRLLGYVSKKILEAVGDHCLEQLVLRVNSPADLQRVIRSRLRLKEIGEIVLGGFHVDSYSDSLDPRLFGPDARKAILRAFVQRNGNRLDNVTLLGDQIDEELELAGFDASGLDFWTRKREVTMIGEINDWSEDGNDWLGPSGIIDENPDAEAGEDEEMDVAESS